jgi:tyrosyl-tRNA synthetase
MLTLLITLQVLADEATKMLHGEECLASIHSTVESLFSRQGAVGAAAGDLESLPKFTLTEEETAALQTDGGGLLVVDVLIKAEYAKSKGEAKRMIAGGGARVNDVKVEDEAATISRADFDALQGRVKISSGKKKHALVVL